MSAVFMPLTRQRLEEIRRIAHSKAFLVETADQMLSELIAHADATISVLVIVCCRCQRPHAGLFIADPYNGNVICEICASLVAEENNFRPMLVLSPEDAARKSQVPRGTQPPRYPVLSAAEAESQKHISPISR